MQAISDLHYEAVNPSTCRIHLREYVLNSSMADDPDAAYDLQQAGDMLYSYVCEHYCELDLWAQTRGWLLLECVRPETIDDILAQASRV